MRLVVGVLANNGYGALALPFEHLHGARSDFVMYRALLGEVNLRANSFQICSVGDPSCTALPQWVFGAKEAQICPCPI